MAEHKSGDHKNRGKGSSWRFSARERRAILFLLPIVAVLVWILWSVARPRYDESITVLGDRMVAEAQANRSVANGPASEEQADRQQYVEDAANGRHGRDEPRDRTYLFCFDPNTVAYEEMRAMGISARTAAGIVKYRQRGKVFQIPEDFAVCYGITDSIYAALKPYIMIGPEYRLKPAEYRREQEASHSGPAGMARAIGVPAVVSGGPEPAVTGSTAAASVTAETTVGLESPEIAGVAESPDRALAVRREQERIDLNSADSLELVSVRGIGPRTATEIIAYREKLGGFHCIEQVRELWVVTERNYEAMAEQIWADSCKIQKIDINFATPNTVSQHPYISGKKLRMVLKNRQMRGGWSTIEDMIEDNTLTPEEAARLAPYLHFTALSHEKIK